MTKIVVAILITGIIGIAIASAWASVLTHSESDTVLATFFPWPIACTVRGCITSQDWAMQRSYDIAFASKTGKSFPTEESTLTTLMRRHLITHARLQSPVSAQDAVRYRTAILHTTDISSIAPLGMSSFTQYDTTIILPFLQQEAFMKQENIADTNALYKKLAQARPIALLLFKYHWNIDRGEVE